MKEATKGNEGLYPNARIRYPDCERQGTCEGFSFERLSGRADFVWGGEESFRNTVKDIVFAVVNDHSPSEGKLQERGD